jgi:hypothetical protein
MKWLHGDEGRSTKKHGKSSSYTVTVPSRLIFVKNGPDRACQSKEIRGTQIRHRHEVSNGPRVCEIYGFLFTQPQGSGTGNLAKLRTMLSWETAARK